MKLRDDSIINDEGDLVYISVEIFLRDICEGDNCFLCGKTFKEGRTKEHIIPDWILRKFDLHDKLVNLPNETGLRYGTYVVPCCDPCNGKLSKELETPLSSLISEGFGAVAEYVQEKGSEKLFVWMCLIFIKTHLKDEETLGSGLSSCTRMHDERPDPQCSSGCATLRGLNLKKPLLYFVGLIGSGIICLLSGIYYAVTCQWGCDYLAVPAVYPYFSFWVFLVVSFYLLFRLVRLVLFRK